MTTTFKRSLTWSIVLHGVVLGALCLSVGFSNPEKPTEAIQWLDVAPMPGEGGAPAPVESTPPPEPVPTPPAPAELPAPPQPTPADAVEPSPPEPPPPTPTPEPAVEPIPPKPQPAQPAPKKIESKPAPTPSLKEPNKPRIKVSTTRVTRVLNNSSAGSSTIAGSADKGKASRGNGISYSTGRFSQSLLAKLGKNGGGLVWAPGATGTGTSGAGVESEYGWYFNTIMQEMYGAWQPPFGMPEGMGVKVLLYIEKTGVISRVSLDTSSSNQALDDSALNAANRVKKLPPPPEGLGNPTAKVTVLFKIQKL